MDTTMGREGGSPRHYVVRKFLTRLQDYASKAEAVYECWDNGGMNPEVAAREIDGYLDHAERYADRGLALIATRCLAKPDEGRADQARTKLATMRANMLGDIRSGSQASDGLGRSAHEEFREMLLAFSIDVSPEGSLRHMALDPSEGLRQVGASACPVILQGGEGDKLLALVNGKPVEPPLVPGMYRAVAKIIRAFVSGNVGIRRWPEDEDDNREFLGDDQGDLSRLLKKHPDPWATIIFTPMTRGPRGGAKLYGINPSEVSRTASYLS